MQGPNETFLFFWHMLGIPTAIGIAAAASIVLRHASRYAGAR